MKAKLLINNSRSQNSRLSWLGKERDKESGLGDHGVRKYDNISGRFLSIDPLWEKYLSWTPYQYSMNDPINKLDIDGRDVVVLLDKQGASHAGHTAVLIGNDLDGWYLYSKNGTDENFGFSGKSKYQDGVFYKNFDMFLKDTEKDQVRYDNGYKISASKNQDDKMKAKASEQVKSDYNLLDNSCADTPSEALKSIRKPSGTSEQLLFHQYGSYYKTRKNPFPIFRYQDIKSSNASGEDLDLNQMRNSEEVLK